MDAIQAHKITWTSKNGTVIPGYVALGECENGGTRLLLMFDGNGAVSRTGTGGITSKSTSEQIEQRAQGLAQLLVRGDFAAFSQNFSPWLPENQKNASAILNDAASNLGTFQKFISSRKDPYVDLGLMQQSLLVKLGIKHFLSFCSNLGNRAFLTRN